MKAKTLMELHFRLQSYDLNSLKDFNQYLQFVAEEKNFNLQSINLPVKLQKFTVVKSPHVNKKARDQYEVKFFNRLYVLKGSNFSWEFLKKLKFHPNISIKLLLKN